MQLAHSGILLAPPCSSIHQTATCFICTQGFPPAPTVVSRHQTSTQTQDTSKSRRARDSCPSVRWQLCAAWTLQGPGTQCPAQADRPWWGVLGKLPTSWGFLHQGQKEAFQKGGAVLNAGMDLQACLGFSAASSHTHIKESFRPAAIRGPVTR